MFAYGDRYFLVSMKSKYVFTRLAAVSTRLLPLMLVCPLIACSIVGIPNAIICWSEVIMAAISGLWW